MFHKYFLLLSCLYGYSVHAGLNQKIKKTESSHSLNSNSSWEYVDEQIAPDDDIVIQDTYNDDGENYTYIVSSKVFRYLQAEKKVAESKSFSSDEESESQDSNTSWLDNEELS